MNTTGWLKRLRVTADDTGIVSHAKVALIRALSDNIGLMRGLSRALASLRLLVHDRGRMLADLACAIADGAEVISDFRVVADQEDLLGLVASVPTAWRMLAKIARAGRAWTGSPPPGAGPGSGSRPSTAPSPASASRTRRLRA